jgi:hypothetical protein
VLARTGDRQVQHLVESQSYRRPSQPTERIDRHISPATVAGLNAVTSRSRSCSRCPDSTSQSRYRLIGMLVRQ